MNFALTLSSFLIDGVVASVRIAQNETPKMAKNVHFYQQIVTFFRRTCLSSDNETFPEHVETTPLFLSILNPSFGESIQYFVTDSFISINNYIQMGFPYSDFVGKFTKLSMHLQLLTWTIIKISAPETASILMSRTKDILTAVVAGRANPHQPTLAKMAAHN